MASKKLLRAAFIKTLPVMAGYIVLGIGAGVLAAARGYNVMWVLVMSLWIFGGSAQYIGIDLMASGAGLVSTALICFMVQARHLFYGISMVGRYKRLGKKKWYMAFALTDETYSLVCSDEGPPGEDAGTYYFLISVFNHAYWVIGTVLGGILGTLVPFDSRGIEFAMTALFAAVFTEQWMKEPRHRYALLGVGASLIGLLVFGREAFLIPSMALIGIGLFLIKKREERQENGDG